MTLSLTAMISIDRSKTGLVYDQKVMVNSLGRFFIYIDLSLVIELLIQLSVTEIIHRYYYPFYLGGGVVELQLTGSLLIPWQSNLFTGIKY